MSKRGGGVCEREKEKERGGGVSCPKNFAEIYPKNKYKMFQLGGFKDLLEYRIFFNSIRINKMTFQSVLNPFMLQISDNFLRLFAPT